MKKSMKKRVLAILLAAVMVVGLIPTGLTLKNAKAADPNVYTFDATTLTAAEDKEALTGKVADDFVTVFGTVQKRTGSSGVTSVEIAKNAGGGFEFTITGTATVSVVISSTGGSNTSAFAIVNLEGAAMADSTGATTVEVTGSASGKKTVTYELEAGTYQMVSPESSYNRGTRVYSFEITEVPAAATTITNYSFDATTLTAAEDKEALTGKVASDYASVFGTVQKRTGSSGVTSVELAKNAGGGFEFTVAGTATVNVVISSTGGSNTSTFAIVNLEGTAMADSTGATTVEVTGSSSGKKTVTYELEAGTYQMVSPESSYNRGVRVYSFDIEEVQSASTTTTYLFDATTLTAAEDKEALTGKVASDFATAFGTVQKRTGSSGVSSVEIAKNAGGGFEFTVTGTATVSVVISSTGGSNTSTFAIVSADGTAMPDSTGATTVEVTGSASGKKTVSYELGAGTYQMVSPESSYNRGTRIYSFEITETTGSGVATRPAWLSVAAPVIDSAVADGSSIEVTYTMQTGYNGADSVVITLKNAAGEVIDSETISSTKTGDTIEFKPSSSGEYSVEIVASREGETDKVGETKKVTYVLPLATPVVGAAYSKGNGSMAVEWSAVEEAESYTLMYSKDELVWDSVDAGSNLDVVLTGLTVGTKYSFKVVAKRGSDSSESAIATATVVAEAQQKWGYIVYGNGANANKASFTGSAYDGSVQLTSGVVTADGTLTGKSGDNNGKLVPASYDGINFYYTEVPASLNFTLKAKVTVDQWALSNAQEGFGLMAADQLGGSGWNNSYMAVASKMEYYWDEANSTVTTDTSAKKVTHKLGIGIYERYGVTKDNLAAIEAGDTATIQNDFKANSYPLEQRYPEAGNIVGNAINAAADNGAPITEMYLTIQKNNTGYFVTYESVDGSYSVTKKYYDPKALEQIDSDNVYVGFFTARYAQATFSDIQFTTIDPKDDAPAEERPVEKIAVNTAVQSATATGNPNYEFLFNANCDGKLTITDASGKVLAENVAVTANKTVKPLKVTLENGKNDYTVTFTPDADYVPGESQVMESYEAQVIKHSVTYKTYGEASESLWVAPDAKGVGTKESPMSIYEAVKYVQPGQQIILMEGTYKLNKTVKVERGIDGTADAKMYMIADPDAKTRPVLDFQGICAGMVLAGDYWYFSGFDVTNSANAQKGMQISGSNCIVDQVNAYNNGNTGIQISRYLSTDLWEDWPANNLILNCTSYNNADAGYEDADGFAAKLTVADGNVFDGCIAYNNADDGWDLFAKVQTGPIGSVTIKNCVTFGNGFLLDGTNAGNGNGFKLGGDSISGKHVLENCIVYDNKAKGIDSNSCPDVIVKNCTTFNNGSYNVAFYTNTATNTDFDATGIISFRTEALDVTENIKPKGTQPADSEKIYNDTNYYWDVTAAASLNKSGAQATADWFVSLDTSVMPTRNADGTINMNGLLELTDKAVADAGARFTATNMTPSYNITVASPYTGDTTQMALYIILALLSVVAVAGVVIADKKRKSVQ